ncbi:MAG: ParB/RepB/Spo0J family partition protein [Phycisphaerales bacterium JB050]
MARSTKPRLGRGLSSLMSEPVQVEPKPTPSTAPSSPPVTKTDAIAPTPEATAANVQPEADAKTVIQHIPLGSIIPNKFQPRTVLNEDELQGLAASIRETGLMQPIAVRPDSSSSSGGAERYELIAGERRWRAAKLAGLERIPAIVHTVDDQQSAEWAIIENVQREDLNPIDRGLAYANLSRKFGLTQSEIAARVGVDRSTIANLIRIVELEPEIRDLIAGGQLSTGHAKALLSMPAGAKRIEIARTAVERSQTVRALEAICSSQGEEQVSNRNTIEDVQEAQIAAAIDDLAKGIGEHLGTRVKIRTKNGLKGTLEIEFYDLDHFDGLMNRMGYTARV